MGDVANLFEAIEKLAYMILLWIVLIPKTLWNIIVKPSWVPGYISTELKREKSAFDDHVSPIILFLVVALIPILILLIQPEHGVVMSSPSETSPTLISDVVEFDAGATFISASETMRDRYTWFIERIETDKETGEIIRDEDGYPLYSEIYREVYDEASDITTIIDLDLGYIGEETGEKYTYLNRNKNSSTDALFYIFIKPGYYFVNVEVARFSLNRNDVPLEEYKGTYLYTYVPENQEESIYISNSNIATTPLEGVVEKINLNSETSSPGDLFHNNNLVITLAIILMTPPLFFSLAIKALTQENISGISLKENFYIQCYYFAPLFLTFWTSFYGWYFYTIDIFSYNYIYILTMFLPLTWAVIWFIYAETHAISLSLNANGWVSFFVAIACMSIIVMLAGLVVYFFSDTNDSLRKVLIWAYPFVFHLALAGLILIRILSWVSNQKKLLVSDVIMFILFIPSIVIFVGGNLLGVIASTDTLTPTVVSYPPLPIISSETITPTVPTATAIIPVETSVIIIQPSPTINSGSYVLHKGEFLYCIARRFNIHPDQLVALNGYVNGQTVSEGTLILIPQGSNPFPGNRSLLNHPAFYTVKSLNETLFSVACLFGDVDPNAIAQANGITTSASLIIGQQLNIP